LNDLKILLVVVKEEGKKEDNFKLPDQEFNKKFVNIIIKFLAIVANFHTNVILILLYQEFHFSCNETFAQVQ